MKSSHTPNCGTHLGVCSKTGKAQPEGSAHQFRASLVFTAFTLEAYLNHLGRKLFRCWDDLERLGPIEKLNVIADRAAVKIDYGKRPWQAMKQLFGFRNDIAHGKSEMLKSNGLISRKSLFRKKDLRFHSNEVGSILYSAKRRARSQRRRTDGSRAAQSGSRRRSLPIRYGFASFWSESN